MGLEKAEVESPAELQPLSRHFLSSYPDARVIAFFGEMGAGKTTFIKFLCKALGVNENVSSPTFSIINEYHSADDEPVYHFDFYRINSIQEAIDLGLDEYFYSGRYCFVEWPEKILHLLPQDRTDIHIEVKYTTRLISIHYGGRTS